MDSPIKAVRQKVVVKAIITRSDGRILALRRSANDSRPGTWDLPGGNLQLEDKNLVVCARREIHEEVGIPVGELFLHKVGTRVSTRGNQVVTICYRTTCNDHDVITLSPDHDDHNWVTPDEFLLLESTDCFAGFVRSLS